MFRSVSYWRQRAVRYCLLAEAAMFLVAARVALRLLDFRQLVWFFELAPRQPEVTGAERTQLRNEARWAISTLKRYLPFQTTCFHRAIAAQAMLRRRKIGATMYYGAATLPEKGLCAHVWVRDGDEAVVGCLAAKGYHILARYPEGNP